MHKGITGYKNKEVIVVVPDYIYRGTLNYIGEQYIVLSNSVIGNKEGKDISGNRTINMKHIISICEDYKNI
jgi:hypothetical protein